MKPVKHWNSTPYTPLDRPERALSPYICRLVPGRDNVSLEWFDNGAQDVPHTFLYRVCGAAEWTESALDGKKKSAALAELTAETEYECFIRRESDGVQSEVRRFRTHEIPWTVVNYLHPEDPIWQFSGHSLCSPCLIRLPGGRLLSSMDVFQGNRPQNLTLIYYSDDDGASWHYLTELFPCFWGQMFLEGGRLYMLGVSNEYGDLLIGASDDGGMTWTQPTILFRGSACTHERGLHRAPMRILHSHGRVWTDIQYGSWDKREMNDGVLSAPEGCDDYTDPDIWVLTDFWRHQDNLGASGTEKLREECRGAIEGNLIEAPDGTLYDFLRYAHKHCLLLRVDPDDPEKKPEYADVVDMEITTSKFDLQRDPVSGDYFAICSRALEEPKTQRNLLSLFRSPDLWHWTCVSDLIDERYSDPAHIGFQYISFLIEGDDILYLSRTAHGQSFNYHDANYQTFHRIRNFRDLH